MGPQDFRILQKYWGRLQIVAREEGYYGSAFQGFRGVTQGDPLSPTIFNVVVYAVVMHWVEIMVEGVGEQGGHG